MATAGLSEAPVKSLNDPDLKAKLQELRRTDNFTNWYYILRTYIYLALVIGGTIWFYETLRANQICWGYSIPVVLLAIVLVGAGQHQLTGLAHEGSHHILFRNRYLNDLAADWLTMFPLFSTLYHYRLQHHAHHQFVNDPERDPDVSQLKSSGHWLPFPLPRAEALRSLLRQLWIPNLIRFMRIRARYNTVGTDKNPYLKKGWAPSKLPVRIGILYLLGMVGLLTGLVYLGDPLWLAVGPALLWLPTMLFYFFLPDDKYHQSRVKPVVSLRWMTIGRLTYAGLVFTGLAWATYLTGRWAALWYLLLWVVPIFTSFSFFMILRQIVQHGNSGRGWLTNTRVFFVNRIINFAVFPMGQDYHLPHHIYASVPHYRLRKLHEILLDYPEYREQAVVVEGYFLPRQRPPTKPTVLDVLGPDYAPRAREVHIDNSVLEDEVVEDRDAILREGEMEKAKVT